MIIMSPLTLLFDILERLSSSALPLRSGFSGFQTISVSFCNLPSIFTSPLAMRVPRSGAAFSIPPRMDVQRQKLTRIPPFAPPAATLPLGARAGAAPSPAKRTQVPPGSPACRILHVIIFYYLLFYRNCLRRQAAQQVLSAPVSIPSSLCRPPPDTGKGQGTSGPSCCDHAGGISM